MQETNTIGIITISYKPGPNGPNDPSDKGYVKKECNTAIHQEKLWFKSKSRNQISLVEAHS